MPLVEKKENYPFLIHPPCFWTFCIYHQWESLDELKTGSSYCNISPSTARQNQKESQVIGRLLQLYTASSCTAIASTEKHLCIMPTWQLDILQKGLLLKLLMMKAFKISMSKLCLKQQNWKKSTNCFARIFGCTLMPVFVCFVFPMLILKSLCLQYTHGDKGESVFSTGL